MLSTLLEALLEALPSVEKFFGSFFFWLFSYISIYMCWGELGWKSSINVLPQHMWNRWIWAAKQGLAGISYWHGYTCRRHSLPCVSSLRNFPFSQVIVIALCRGTVLWLPFDRVVRRRLASLWSCSFLPPWLCYWLFFHVDVLFLLVFYSFIST